jgi:hypothetical protein
MITQEFIGLFQRLARLMTHTKWLFMWLALIQSAYTGLIDNIQVGPQRFVVHEEGPVSEIVALGTDETPKNFLYCDGSAVSRTTYAELYASIGTNFGEGDGSTTFNVPDLRGYFLRGQDDGTGTDPDAGSRTALNTGGNTGTMLVLNRKTSTRDTIT